LTNIVKYRGLRKMLPSFSTWRHIGLFFKNRNRESGLTLIELLISIALLGILSIAVYAGFATDFSVLKRTSDLEKARNLAELQMEYIMASKQYSPFYYPIPVPEGFAGFYVVTDTDGAVHAESIGARDANIQQITIEIKKQSNPDFDFQLTGYKSN
jgi:prepilin-type N-terminal cleavage/methylation domain-containing protein